MKSVLISIQPYYVFLIIARIMGWDIPQEKTVEVRKDCPKDSAWNKVTHIYCSKNRKSFNRIPKQYQPFMAKFLGKVIGEFVCDRIDEYKNHIFAWRDKEDNEFNVGEFLSNACLTADEAGTYISGKSRFYAWHVSNLKIYDKPKELWKFEKPHPVECPIKQSPTFENTNPCCICGNCTVLHPPQSWFYVGGLAA